MEKEECDKAWKSFLRRHSQMSLFLMAFAVFAAAAAILVFLGVVAEAQATGLVPAMLAEWSVAYCITFILHLAFWELVFVGTWSIPIALLAYRLWYRALPAKERKEYEKKGGHGGREDGFSLLCGIIWLAIVWLGGKWGVAFKEWALNDWVFTWLSAFLWTAAIVGIPALIYLLVVMSGKTGK